MIKGITHDESGKVKDKLPVIGKVATGKAPDDNTPYPRKTDHFMIKKRKRISNNVKWVQDEQLMSEFSKNNEPKEIPIMFLSNNIDGNLRSALNWWKSDHLHCFGDGETGWRWDDSKEERVKWDCKCEKFEEGKCKPNGQLWFTILSDKAEIGGVYGYYTTSSRTIRQLYTNLKTIKSYTSTDKQPSGRLRGLPLRLKLYPDETKFKDKSGEVRETIHYYPYVSFMPKDLENDNIIDILNKRLGKIDDIDPNAQVTKEDVDEEIEDDDLEIDEITDDFDDEEEIFGQFIED